MRQQKQSDRLINRICHLSRQDEKGSIVVEAAIVMPFILILLLFFAFFLSICTMQMALHSTAIQSTRQLASYIRPVELARQQLEEEWSDPTSVDSRSPDPLPSWSEVAIEAAAWLPEPSDELVIAALSGNWRPLQNIAATELGRGVIEPYVRQFVNEQLLHPERVKLTSVTLPDLKNKEEPYIGIELEYELGFKLPFTNRTILIKERSYERVWVEDAAPATDLPSMSDSTTNIPIQIVAISPTPLSPGSKATVLVKTAPEAELSLGIQYKSGASKAKHLGEATADENGFVQWTWLVSGNTTPGIWKLQVSALGSDHHESRFFIVAKGVGEP